MYALYAQAYALRSDKLIKDITEWHCETMTPKNVVHVFQDAIEFENSKLQTECEKMIITHFHEVLSVSEEFVLSLPKVNLVNLLKYDSL